MIFKLCGLQSAIIAYDGLYPTILYVKDFVNKPSARPFETFIVNPNLKKLLSASKIKFANLNTSVFKVNVSTKLSDTSYVNVDYFLRSSLYDAFYTEELLGCALEIVPMLKAQLQADYPGMDKSSLDFLLKLLSLISLSNQRSFHGQTAAIVANKSGLRNYVLSKFQVPASTAEVLRGTDFAAEGVFGELPSFLLDYCDSTNGKFLTCRPKPSVKSSSVSSLSIKRISPAVSQQSFKKLKLSSFSDQVNVSVDQKEPKKRNPLLWDCQR